MALGKSPSQIVASGDYPLLEIAPHWERVALGDVATVQNGAPFSSEYFTHGEGMPLIRIRDVDRDTTENFYSGPYEAEFVVTKGDILVGMDGDFHAALWKGTNGLLNQRVCRITLKTSLYSKEFLFLVLQPYLNAINAETSSVTVKHLSSRSVAEIPLPLPPLPEQKRIVARIEELFSELEAGEESLRVARRQLGVYRQSLLKQAFGGKLTEKWRAQNPDKLESPASLLARIQSARQAYHEQQLKDWKAALKEWESVETDEKRPPKPQKVIPTDESIPVFDAELPQSWTTLNLSQFVLELGQGWSPKCEGREAQGEQWSVIKTTAIQFGLFDASANKALPEELPPRRWLALRAGDILITRAGPRSRCGVVCRVRADHPRIMLCDKAYRLVVSERATSSEFIERLLCSPAAMAAIEKLKTGINDSGVNITQGAFLQLALPIPPLPEQQEIVRLLDEQFEVIERNEREIDAALKRSEALRQAILHRAFTGRLVPQDPADPPASALLARLRAERSAAPAARRARAST